MLFWIYMFLVTLIIPCAMYFVGKKYLTSPPKYINNTKGFRTKRSMKNPLTWEFAQKHFTVFDKGIIIKHNKNRANLH